MRRLLGVEVRRCLARRLTRALIGVAPGDTVGIQHVGNSLIVHPAGVVPTFRDEPVPAAG